MQRPTPSEPQRASSDSLLETRIEVLCFGASVVAQLLDRGNSKPLLGPGKPFGVLAFLLLAPGRTASRDRLVDLLWADLDPAAGRHQLRNALSLLRSRLGAEVVSADDRRCTLSGRIRADVLEFREAFDRADFSVVLRRYRGPFLDGFSAPGSSEFELWADGERRHFQSLAITAAEAWCRAAIDDGRFADARSAARQLRSIHPDSEFAWRLLLEALVSGGDTTAALAEAERFDQWLHEQGGQPEPASVAVIRAARATVAMRSTDHTAQVLSGDLVGREAEFRAILTAWHRARESRTQLVLLNGAAGLGKSRLLSDVAGRLRFAKHRTLLVRAFQGDRPVPFAFLVTLLRALTELPGALAVHGSVAATLLETDPRLASVYRSVEPSRADPGELLVRRGVALQELLRAVADEAPLALLIDDAHWIDDASLSVLCYSLFQIGGSRILAVVTSRKPIAALEGPDEQRRSSITLSALNATQVRALIASIGALPDDDSVTEVLISRVADSARGVPLLILDALAQLTADGSLGLTSVGWCIPDKARLLSSLADLDPLAARIRGLSVVELRLLVAFSIAGLPLPPEALRLLASRVGGSIDVIHRLDHLGYIRLSPAGAEVAHDSIAEAALSLSSSDLRRAAEHDLGVALSAMADPRWLSAAARHLCGAGEADELVAVIRSHAASNLEAARSDPEHFVAAILGVTRDDPIIHRLVGSLPLSTRAYRTLRVIAAAGLSAVALAASLALASKWPATKPDAVMEIVIPAGSLRARTASIPLSNTDWSRLDPIPLRLSSERVDSMLAFEKPIADPFGDAWAVEEKSPDSRGNDIVLLGKSRGARRLTRSAYDNTPNDWSPDGSQLVISTSAFSATGFKTLAIVDRATGRLRQFGPSRDPTGIASWSPDGTRIAYASGPLGTLAKKLCVVTISQIVVVCSTSTVGPVVPLGWISDTRLLVRRGTIEQSELAEFDAQTGTFAIVDVPNSNDWQLSDDRRWLVARGTNSSATVYVAPASNPKLFRRLSSEIPNDARIRWRSSSVKPEYLDTVAIVAPADSVPLGAPFLLRARGRSNLGRDMPLRVANWASLSQNVAGVDSLGQLIPIREGSVTVTLSAGGWRQVSRTFVVVPQASRLIATEDWTKGLTNMWIAFGHPFPKTLTDSVLGHAFLNNGDGDYFSGAYARTWFDGRKGLAIDFDIRAWISESQQQFLDVGLTGAPGLGQRLAEWNHITGYIPREGGPIGMCAIQYPAREGPYGFRELRPIGELALGISKRAPPVATGTPLHIRLQLLPDGRCGVAVDGERPVLRPEPLPGLDSLLFLIQGNSVRTKVLVGPITFAVGVPTGIDWGHARLVP